MFGVLVGVLMALWLGATAPAFAAYQHAGETTDPASFLASHPEAAGTKLDSCALCHSGGSYVSGGKTTTLGSCMWCHYLSNYTTSKVTTATLNPYGSDFLAHGRNAAAITAIDGLDSDGDGYKNVDEIAALTYPGDPTDNPSAVQAAARVYTLPQIQALPQHNEFLLMNGSKSTDFYGTYTGPTMEDLLKNAGILHSATQINVVSPDGFSQYFPLDPGTSTVAGMYPVRWTYPSETFYYNPQADFGLNSSLGWCDYSSPGCAGMQAGAALPAPGGQKMLVAYLRDGSRLTTGVLDATNKLNGEGPFRVIPPQLVPGPPDIGSNASTQAVIWPYSSNNDHNSGYSPRTATMVKVGPMPSGTTDINTLEAGWPYVDSDSIVVYGAIDPVPTARANAKSLAAYVSGLPSGVWATAGEGSTLAAQISAFDSQLAGGSIWVTISKIENDLLLKTDGVVLRGTPDAGDWITETTAQRKVYWGLKGIATLLRAADPLAPATTISGVPSVWTKSNVTFSLSATGAPTPLTTYSKVGTATASTYTTPVVVSKEGTTTVQYWSVNASGQAEATQTATIRIDKTVPTTTLTNVTKSDTASDTVLVSFTAKDTASGVAHKYCVVDGGPTVEVTGPTPVTGVGIHVVNYWSVDVAGNQEATKTGEVDIFAPAPGTASLSKSPAGLQYTIVRHHGVAHFAYSATLESLGGAIAGKTILLQKSADGVNFTTVRGASMVTDADGKVTANLEFRGAGTGYWRWLFAGDSDWDATSTSTSRITIR